MKEIIKPQRGSLAKIAVACGCSKPTVSQILNGHGRYTSELTKRVRYVAITQYGGKKYMKPELKEVETD